MGRQTGGKETHIYTINAIRTDSRPDKMVYFYCLYAFSSGTCMARAQADPVSSLQHDIPASGATVGPTRMQIKPRKLFRQNSAF